MPHASAPSAPAPTGRRKPFSDDLPRRAALVFLSLFHLQLKVIGGLVRFAIAALRRRPGAPRR